MNISADPSLLEKAYTDIDSLSTGFPLTNLTEEGILYEVPTGLVILLAILYGSISVMAVIGNGLVILVIVKNKKMQTVTNLFIANLATADVILGMFSIPFQFQAALLQRWIFADFLCSLAPYVLTMSVSLSVFTLTVIAIDRYFAVLHPLKPRFTKRSAVVVLTIIWLISSVSSLPEALFYKVKRHYPSPDVVVTCCSMEWPAHPPNFAKIYRMYLLLAQYLLPLTVITFAYLRIGCHIWLLEVPGIAVDNRDNIRTRNKRRVVKMLLVVVCLFVLCWMPLQTYNLLSEVYSPINDYEYINIIWFCFNWLAMSNSCYNPFIYGLLNEKFKREFRQLCNVCFCRKEKRDLIGPDFSDDSVQPIRKYSVNDNAQWNRTNFDNSRSKRYIRVQTEYTEQSMV